MILKHCKTISLALSLVASAVCIQAASITTTTFATGSGATNPDSITSDGSSIYVEYGNGASAFGADTKSSTIVRYSLNGTVLQTYTVSGLLDGLKYNSFTGKLWALQNNDGNSKLTIVDPATSAQTTYTYAAAPANATTTPGNGFDDAIFAATGAYLTRTNPGGDPNAAALVFATLSGSTVNVAPVLLYGAAGTTLAGMSVINDPDSLKLDLNGSLVISSGDDGATITIANPGPGQTVTPFQITDSMGAAVSGLDDTAFTNASFGTLLVTDTPGNVVKSLFITGLKGTTEFASVGSLHTVGIVDQTTGALTPIGSFSAGAAPHGLLFIPNADVVTPEPASIVMILSGLGGIALLRRKKRS